MSDKFDTVTLTLSAATGLGGSFTASYPLFRSADDYLGAGAHEIHTQSYRSLFAANGDFAVTFGASNITVTLLTALSMVEGTRVTLNLDRAERNASLGEVIKVASEAAMTLLQAVRINLGAPQAAAAAGICASQALNTGVDGVLNGSLVVNGAVSFNTPRNIVAAWTNTAVITVTGTDEYGNVLVESSASGTSFTGKKAFKTVTRVRVSANVTGMTVGTGTVLGLPAFLADAADVIREANDGAVPGTGGTFVAGDQTAASATTGDVRGTYAPNQAPNGTRVYELTVLMRDPTYRGRAQFAG